MRARSISITSLFIVGAFLWFLGIFYNGQNAANVIFMIFRLKSYQWFSELQNRIGNQNQKWIVITSIQYPTDDVKKLAAQKDWNLVVVADAKSPPDWNYTSVHYLTVERQKKLFGDFAMMLPFNSYTRKNLGYLYAMMNGAEWIYDTDDDNKPFDLGLEQFDYNLAAPVSGLRYISKSETILEKLFNPYRFYGFDNMWPRGFPLEYIEHHTNGKDRMVSCREMKPAAVQQGVVMKEPDVDAIYRLLHAEQDFGLDVEFNSIAPSIVLGSATYSPWNSQNTLFNYKAFFIMYLPTTVAFRVTDIWRSYFGQKLLHLIGENIAFYPPNAVQIRNAHNYLNDFRQEIDVYEQSGNIVKFLDNWKCSQWDTVKCVLELADGFVANNFFGKEDRNLIEAWLKQLSFIGYKFPPLVNGTETLTLGEKYSNCRAANLDLGFDSYRKHNKEMAWPTEADKTWAMETVNGFGEVLGWCEVVNGTGDGNIFLPTGDEFLHNYRNLTGLVSKKETILVFISNRSWHRNIIGLLQRMYSPFFKTTIFCGTWTDPTTDPGRLIPLEPLNFVNITEEEMRLGFSYGYCVSKVNELRLRNVAGYYFVADDTVFNFWHDLPLEGMLNPAKVAPIEIHWNETTILNSYEAFESHQKNNTRIGRSWSQRKESLQTAYPSRNVTDYFLHHKLEVLADFLYIPSDSMEYFGNLIEILSEAEVFVEAAVGKIMDGLAYNSGGKFNYLWDNRHLQWDLYNSSLMGLHPIKLGTVHTDIDYRKRYCDTVVKAFGEEIYGRKTK